MASRTRPFIRVAGDPAATAGLAGQAGVGRESVRIAVCGQRCEMRRPICPGIRLLD